MDKEKQYLEYSQDYHHHIFKKVSKNRKVLDLGCNTGLLGEAL